jgi:pilus assembly protein CpaF
MLRLLQNEIVGAGPLEPLLRDPEVTDVLVNAPDSVWVDRAPGLERTSCAFPDDLAVRRLAQRLAAPTGRRLDDAQPWVDARLPGGVRLHAVLPPVAPGGPACPSGWPDRASSTWSSWPRRAPYRRTVPGCSPRWWRQGWPSW